jgi:hypothetical protein
MTPKRFRQIRVRTLLLLPVLAAVWIQFVMHAGTSKAWHPHGRDFLFRCAVLDARTGSGLPEVTIRVSDLWGGNFLSPPTGPDGQTTVAAEVSCWDSFSCFRSIHKLGLSECRLSVVVGGLSSPSYKLPTLTNASELREDTIITLLVESGARDGSAESDSPSTLRAPRLVEKVSRSAVGERALSPGPAP